jgi:hypothetical protein
VTAPQLVLLGNPDHRRVTGFQAALASQGFAPARVVAWRDYLDGAELPEAGEAALLRVDSFGQDFEVERRLLQRGGLADVERLVDRRGEVRHPRVGHSGFELALDALAADLARRPGWVELNPPAEIAELFDKRRTSRRFEEAGVPVPERLADVPASPAELIERVRALGWPAAFVKLSCGSSASCLAHVAAGSEVLVTTTLEWDAPRWFNTRRVQRLRDPAAIDRALAFILSQGAHVERAVEKARLGGVPFDLRVLCVAGAPAFAVVRQSRLPMTNLHLGGRRGDLPGLLARVPAATWDALLGTCRRVAALYRALHVGVDVMLESGLVTHRVLEANAFGDLLPGLTRGGVSVYEWEIRAAAGLSLPDCPIEAP